MDAPVTRPNPEGTVHTARAGADRPADDPANGARDRIAAGSALFRPAEDALCLRGTAKDDPGRRKAEDEGCRFHVTLTQQTGPR
ncbi:hypothetical protein [Methylobacterium sp. WCS2018Hpa-22]|uniref:hypothetical protein n=1 Tax=Methylobacterium sp. WCS2018Hpa-22 TaxID=3073633 RepID=UPI0038621C10